MLLLAVLAAAVVVVLARSRGLAVVAVAADVVAQEIRVTQAIRVLLARLLVITAFQ